MKRVLHLTHTDIRSDSRILKQMNAAAYDGYEVYGVGVELNEGAKNVGCSKLTIVALRLVSQRFVSLPKPLRHFFTFVELFCKSFFYSIKVRPNIVHANDTLVLPIAVFVKFFSRAKLVYDAHELESDRNGLSKTLSKITKLIEKMCWPFVNALIVVSPSIEKWYMSNIGNKRSEIILNSPIYQEDNPEAEESLREKFDVPEEDLIFIYVGILGSGRGIDLVLNSFEGIKGAHVIFLGYGEYIDRLKACERTQPNVHVHEPVEHSRVVEVVSSADIGLCLIQDVSLSDYYCLPNKLFEYAFAGLPVLASDFPDIRKVVEDYSLGLCVDLTPESVRSGIQWFLDNRSSIGASRKDLSPLSWQAQEDKLLRFYEEISQ